MSAPAQRNPMELAGELYCQVVEMAEQREFYPTATELLVALMMASCMMQYDSQLDRVRVRRRIERQALQFIETGVLKEVTDEEETPPGTPA